MNKNQKELVRKKLVFINNHCFSAMVSLSIVISLALVLFSMSLYYSSGAAQLDLSRPGYSGIRDKIDRSDNFTDFSSIGIVNNQVIDEFLLIFIDKSNEIQSVDAFGGDPLSPVNLEIVLSLSDSLTN